MHEKELDNLIRQAADAPSDLQQQQEQFYRNIVLPRLLSFLRPYPPEVCLFEIEGVPFMAKGDLCAIKAKQKQGKTTALSLMATTLLVGQWGRLRATQPENKIIFIDTEQKPQDTQLVYERIMTLAGRPLADDYDHLQVYTLRTLDPVEMLRLIEEIIRREHPDVVFIDGIVDLIANFNEVEGSQQLIHQLIRLASADVTGQDTALVCVLHTNKNDDDHNMRGHLGTMLSQKSGIVLECQKQGDIFTVRNADSRHRPVPQWSFTYNREGQLVDGDEELERYREEARSIRMQIVAQKQNDLAAEKRHKTLVIMRRNGGRMLRRDLRDKLMKKFNTSLGTTNKFIKRLLGTDIYEDGQYVSLKKPEDNQLQFDGTDT